MIKYISYEVCKGVDAPDQRAESIFKTTNIKQALAEVKNAAERGEAYFIRGVKPSGERAVILRENPCLTIEEAVVQ